MNAFQQSFIIAVSGQSGAGKTTLVRALVEELGNAVPFFFDDYHPRQVASTRYPANMAQWLADGTNPEDWETPQMISDLQILARGETITLPANKGVLKPANFIVMEEPFGRARLALKDLVNFVIILDTPLEIALARRVLRETKNTYHREHPDEFMISLQKYLNNYLNIGRPMYLAINEHAKKECDLTLDGLKPANEIAREAAEHIRATLHLAPPSN